MLHPTGGCAQPITWAPPPGAGNPIRTLNCRCATILSATLLVLTAGATPCSASAIAAAHTRRRTILVRPMDLYDYFLDHRAATVVPLHHWVAHLAGHISADLGADAALKELNPRTAAALRKVRVNYIHPSSCR